MRATHPVVSSSIQKEARLFLWARAMQAKINAEVERKKKKKKTVVFVVV